MQAWKSKLYNKGGGGGDDKIVVCSQSRGQGIFAAGLASNQKYRNR